MESNVPPIYRAAEQGDEAAVSAILAADASQARATIQVYLYGSDTPLHVAAERDHLAIAELLLRHGADVNAIGDMGLTPFHRAANLGHVHLVELLLDHGADPNLRDMHGNTPLNHCTPGRDPEFPRTARLLVVRGSRMNLKAALGMEDAAATRRLFADDSRMLDTDPQAKVLLPMSVQMMLRMVEREIGPLPSSKPIDQVRIVCRHVVDEQLDILETLIARKVPSDQGVMALIAAVDLADTRPAERLLAYGIPAPKPFTGLDFILPGRVTMNPLRAEFEELFSRYQYKWRAM
ncbi:MAG: ankyrin repeat domain-containing protein [Gemmataceae bacterium]